MYLRAWKIARRCNCEPERSLDGVITSLKDNAIFSAAQSAALAPRKEVPSLIPNTQCRPADIYLPNWKRGQGRPAALDVTVISTLQSLTLNQSSSVQGHALMVGEERKRAKHAEACHAVGVSFIPLVAESIGGWSEEAAQTISEIGRLQGQRLGIPPAETTRHLFQRCAISLWKGNATYPVDTSHAYPFAIYRRNSMTIYLHHCYASLSSFLHSSCAFNYLCILLYYTIVCYCAVLYYIGLYCTCIALLYSIVLYCIIALYGAVLCCTEQCCIVLYYCIVLCCIVLYCIVLLHSMVLYCVVLYSVLLYCIIVLLCVVLLYSVK